MKIAILLLISVPLFAQEAPPKPAQEQQPPATEEKKDAGADAKPAEQAAATTATVPTEKTPSETGLSGSADLGYRWISTGGNFDTYRSVVNLGEGVKLFNVDGTIRSTNRRYFDRISVYGMGWGGDPYMTARVDAFKERTYDLRMDYRDIAYYNFLPSFANPLLSQGLSLIERAYDTRIRTFDSELRFLPGTKIMPYIAYDKNRDLGTGVTTFVASNNQYPVWNRISDNNDRVRGGVQIQLSNFHATLEGGGTSYGDDSTVGYSGYTIGNRQTPYFGETLFLSGLQQRYNYTGSSIFTRALVSYSPTSWVDLSGQFLYSRPTMDFTYDQSNTGNFVNPSTLQFFTSEQDFASAYANQPHSSGSYLIDLRPARRLRILESLSRDSFHVASSAVLTQIIAPATEGTPANVGDSMFVNYNRHQTEALFDIAPWFTLRGGFRYVWGDAETRGALTGAVARERAELSQTVGLAGIQLRVKQRLTINGDLEAGTTARAYFRTSLYNYRRSSIRARYQASASLNLTFTQSLTTNTNPTPGINLDFLYNQTSAAAQWNPRAGKWFSILGDYTHSQLRSDILYLVPQNLQPDTSTYREWAHTITGLIEVGPPKGAHAPRVSAGGSYFKSSGSRPTSYYQPQARVLIPLARGFQWKTEWRYYGMGEPFYPYENFRAHVFETGLRMVR